MSGLLVIKATDCTLGARRMPCRRLEAASVHRQTQFEIYLNRVAATLLQGIRPKFVHQTDSASLLAAQTDDGAEARCCHVAQCGAQLPATVASARPKDITGEALGMNANRHVPSSGEIPPGSTLRVPGHQQSATPAFRNHQMPLASWRKPSAARPWRKRGQLSFNDRQ